MSPGWAALRLVVKGLVMLLVITALQEMVEVVRYPLQESETWMGRVTEDSRARELRHVHTQIRRVLESMAPRQGEEEVSYVDSR